jgi:hypothetical protein
MDTSPNDLSVIALPDGADAPPMDGVEEPAPIGQERAPSSRRSIRIEIGVAVAAFLAFAIAVLTKSTALLEPDDYAYRASITALTHGWVLLTSAQYHAVLAQLSHTASPGIAQWDHLKNGSWISEKNPGYPFFAVPFAWAHCLRLAPLFYGAVGATGLFVGGRRWLGRFGGTWAVLAYLSSGAAMAFAWRATMPTFTDASLIAAGLGFGMWAMLAVDTGRRRTVVGLLAMGCFEAAVTIRYTDIAVLIVAVIAVVAFARPAKLARRDLVVWAASLAVSLGAVMAFNATIYGGVTKTGYSAGEITFSLSAIRPNLSIMPWLLLKAMPFAVLAAVAIGWGIARFVAKRTSTEGATVRRDLAVLGTLGAAWASVWGLYLAYTWTAQMSGGTPGDHPQEHGPFGNSAPARALAHGAMAGKDIHLIRFYLPALGALALLAAYTLVRIKLIPAVVVLVALVALGLGSYSSLTSGSGPGAGFPGGGAHTGLPGGGTSGGGTSGGFPSGGVPNGGPRPGGTGDGFPPSGGAQPSGGAGYGPPPGMGGSPTAGP